MKEKRRRIRTVISVDLEINNKQLISARIFEQSMPKKREVRI